jgi:dTDP-4-dehydrorhamnose reductase
MARIFIAGSNGQLGTDCQRVFAEHTLLAQDMPEIDITSRDSVTSAMNEFKPDFLINCAAYTAVDKAESDESLCHAVNAVGPAVLARECKLNGTFLVHISTDYVFSGDRAVPEPWLETDVPSPVTVYGRTKLDGEKAIQSSGCRHAILRTAWLYGAHGKNFPKTMLRLALADPAKTIRVVNDQFGCPTCSMQLALQIKKLIEQPVPPTGLFHAAAQGHTSWYGFAREFLTLMNVPFTMEPCTTADYPTPAHRPANSILENAALKSLGICTMDDWRAALQDFVRQNRNSLITGG